MYGVNSVLQKGPKKCQIWPWQPNWSHWLMWRKDNILSWHYLWDPYGGFGLDGRRIQPVFPSLPSAISKNLAVWASFTCLSLLTISRHKEFGCLGQFLNFHPFPRYINVPGLFGQPNIANILSWHYIWDPFGGFGHDGRRIQPAFPSLPSAAVKNLAVWANFELSPTSKIYKCSWIVWPT